MNKTVGTIGRRIMKIREEKGLSRYVLSKVVGCTDRELLRWETTSQEPRAATLKKFADALNVPLESFFDEESDEGNSDINCIIEKSIAKKDMYPEEFIEVRVRIPARDLKDFLENSQKSFLLG